MWLNFLIFDGYIQKDHMESLFVSVDYWHTSPGYNYVDNPQITSAKQ